MFRMAPLNVRPIEAQAVFNEFERGNWTHQARVRILQTAQCQTQASRNSSLDGQQPLAAPFRGPAWPSFPSGALRGGLDGVAA